MSSIGDALRQLRQQRSLTLQEVADGAGVSRSYLSQVESGKIIAPSPQMLHMLARFYGTGPAAFLERAGYLPEEAPTPAPIPFRGAEKLTPRQARAIQLLIDVLTEKTLRTDTGA